MAKAEPRRDIKANILLEARALFKVHGFMKVTMRDIADVLNISVGNLTYHYRRKEELIMAVVNDIAYSLPPLPETIQQLDDLFGIILLHMHENSFLYCQQGQMTGISEELNEFRYKVMEMQRQYIVSTIANLQHNGLVHIIEYPGQRERIAEAIHIVCIYWLPYNAQRSALTNKDFIDCLWSVIYPFLSEKGICQFCEYRKL